MKQIISTQLILIWLSATAFSQNYEYDVQSCFNENETVQEALYESLQEQLTNPDRLKSLYDIFETQPSNEDLENLRPLSKANETDVGLCNYIQSTYPQSKWDRIGNTYYIYHYRSNDFFFSVYVIIPKSIFDPDFVKTENRFRISSMQAFDAQTGFQTGSALIGMKSYPGLELPESEN